MTKSAFHPKKTIHMVKHGGGNIMVWDYSSSAGTGALIKSKGILDSSILAINLLSYWRYSVLKSAEDEEHWSRSTEECQQKMILDWYSQNPGLNPIKNIRYDLKSTLHMRSSYNLIELVQGCIARMRENKIDCCSMCLLKMKITGLTSAVLKKDVCLFFSWILLVAISH